MAIKRKTASINVVKAARIRIKNVFDSGLQVYMSFSGGKDSLVLAHLTYSMIQEGLISPEQLTVQFIDEEGIFPCIEKSVKDWRKRFLLVGARFQWYCLEVKHYNCFNELSNDETFICWDRTKRDVWIRKPPKFAIMNHPLLKPREETYQSFLTRENMDGITLTGVRVYESIQRLKNIANSLTTNKSISKTASRQILPLYDWTDNDIWLYLFNNNIEIPKIYLYLWQVGVPKNKLRVSQFFSIDTAKVLVKMNEFYPDLMERVVRREPNAYLASLYWDSEMFGRNTRTRKQLEEEDKEDINYKEKLIQLFNNMEEYFTTKEKYRVAKTYRNFFLHNNLMIDEKDYKKIYESLKAGDPKLRNLRAFYISSQNKYVKKAKKGEV